MITNVEIKETFSSKDFMVGLNEFQMHEGFKIRLKLPGNL